MTVYKLIIIILYGLRIRVSVYVCLFVFKLFLGTCIYFFTFSVTIIYLNIANYVTQCV